MDIDIDEFKEKYITKIVNNAKEKDSLNYYKGLLTAYIIFCELLESEV